MGSLKQLQDVVTKTIAISKEKRASSYFSEAQLTTRSFPIRNPSVSATIGPIRKPLEFASMGESALKPPNIPFRLDLVVLVGSDEDARDVS
jgi:hypothetical protein